MDVCMFDIKPFGDFSIGEKMFKKFAVLILVAVMFGSFVGSVSAESKTPPFHSEPWGSDSYLVSESISLGHGMLGSKVEVKFKLFMGGFEICKFTEPVKKITSENCHGLDSRNFVVFDGNLGEIFFSENGKSDFKSLGQIPYYLRAFNTVTLITK